MKTLNNITQVSDSHNGIGGSSVFFGHGDMILDHTQKSHRFTVCSHLKKGKEYEFRSITKARAGWNTIHDFTCKAEHIWGEVSKHVQCIQVKEGKNWFHIYVTKGGLWETIDNLMLDICTVGDIRSASPKNASYIHWNKSGAQTWADLAFVTNSKKK